MVTAMYNNLSYFKNNRVMLSGEGNQNGETTAIGLISK